jgi:NAD(P)-dependent dehydrogenase (short-subunit alcohol dehydrogenase family)
MAIGADVTDPAAMDAAVEATAERFGRLDVPVANAGIAPPTTTARAMDPEAFERTLEVDLYGVWRTVRPALPHVVAHSGQVVLISSVYAWMNGALAAPYAVAKAGVEALGRALRVELAPHRASATVAHFGVIDTPLVREGSADPLAQRFEQLLPPLMRHRQRPEAAARALVAGIERRSPRVIAPPWWNAWFALRGMASPFFDLMAEHDRAMLELVRKADAQERSAFPGGAAGPSPTPTPTPTPTPRGAS